MRGIDSGKMKSNHENISPELNGFAERKNSIEKVKKTKFSNKDLKF